MEVKKNPQADLENERINYFLLGLIVALSSLFVLLEWSTEELDSPEWEGLPIVFIEEEFIGVDEMPELTSEPTLPVEEFPVKVHEDYNVVEKVNIEEAVIGDLIENITKFSKDTILPIEVEEEFKQEETIYINPEIQPEFPGGFVALNRFLFSKIEYPASAQTQRIQGRVWCSIIVNKDGSVSDPKIEKGVFISLDQEAMRVMTMMPNWNPGTVKGEPVRVKVYIPIVFKL